MFVVGVVLSIVVTVFISEKVSWAAWSGNPSVNTQITNVTSWQPGAEIISDGSDGAIIVWADKRNGNEDIYAQRVDLNGNVLWTANGVAICTASDDQLLGTITTDGAGGAIIVWVDGRNGNWDIYAQRINANGVVQWTTDGVAITTLVASQDGPFITSDGAGGAIIVWEDGRNGPPVNNNFDIYAQRINAGGVVQWVADGVAICTSANQQGYQSILGDGAGGAIILWSDYRSGSKWDLYAQRINVNGVVQWAANGVAVSTAAGEQLVPFLVSDGSGGAIIAWATTYENGTADGTADIRAQRIIANGTISWTANGVAISTLTRGWSVGGITSDGAGGAIIVWGEGSDTSGVSAQRVDSNGNILWTANGVAVATMFYQSSSRIVSDGSGGAIIVWMDLRQGTYYDIYAQRLDSNGNALWTSNGIAVCTAPNYQYNPVLTAGATGEAIIAWTDYRSGCCNIYAQMVNNTFAGLSSSLVTQKQGPTGNSTTYDGNGDGIPDITQSNVTSLNLGATNDAATYVTMAVTTDSGAAPVISTATKTATQDEAGLNLTIGNSGKLPLGTMTFQLTSVQPSIENVVKMHLPTGVQVNKIYKYGATPDNHSAHWYNFTCNNGHPVKPCGEVSTEPGGQKIVTLYLIDGQLGDDDLTVNGTIKDDVAFASAPVDCMLPMLATGGAYTWCGVTNGSSDDATMTFKVFGSEGGSYAGLPVEVSISAANSPHKGETILYFFKGRNIYKGSESAANVVVSESSLSGLPATGSGFYAARLSIGSDSAAVNNIAVSCFQMDPHGPKRPLTVSCN
jgi:hypothetical protein